MYYSVELFIICYLLFVSQSGNDPSIDRKVGRNSVEEYHGPLTNQSLTVSTRTLRQQNSFVSFVSTVSATIHDDAHTKPVTYI